MVVENFRLQVTLGLDTCGILAQISKLHMTIKQIACIQKRGFLLGYFTKKQISFWADNRILEGYEDFNILELSLLKNKSDSEILVLIDDFIGTTDLCTKDFLDEYFLGYCKEVLYSNLADKETSMNVEKEILKYHNSLESDFEDDLKLFISILNNDYSLRRNGLNGVIKIPDDLIIFLEPYQKFNEIQSQLNNSGFPFRPSWS